MKQFGLMILGLYVLFAIGCSDFLEEKSQDEVIPTTTTDYNEVLLGYMYAQSSFDMLNVLSDEFQINESKLSSYSESSTAIRNYGCFTWQPNMWELENTLDARYQYLYTQIMGINAVLDGVDDCDGKIEDKEIIKAQALGLRALGYFMLVNLFGEPYNYNKAALGVPLKLESQITGNGIARSSVEKVYEQIVGDLEKASELFAKYPKQRGNFRVNGTTVDILLSRVYLYMERYDDAITVATRAIESSEGLTDYTQIAEGTTFYLNTYDNSEVEWVWGNQTFESDFTVSDTLRSLFVEGDRREDLWFNGDYIPVKLQTNGTSPTNTIRISEAYLNRAEARVLSKNQDVEGALSDLNELRRHRIVNYQDITTADESVLLNTIRNERFVELSFEGHRWFDLRRYGMPSFSHAYKTKKKDNWVVYTLQEKDPLYTLPIPEVAFNNNNLLEQNASAYESERTGVSM